MAQPATNPKIEELRFRLKSDPRNRIFYPLAEELRKISQFVEAEGVLRTGLTHHPTYLSAWVSLGRVLREQGKNGDAVEAFSKALQLDPGNVVAARLLADSYLSLGQKVEAIKKYKLVHALLPADEELEAVITRLDRELNPPVPVAEPEPEPEPEREPEPQPEPVAAAPAPEPPAPPPPPPPVPALAEPGPNPFSFDEEPEPEPEEPFDDTAPVAPPRVVPFKMPDTAAFDDASAEQEEERRVDEATGDVEPMRDAHAESPFEEPAGYTSAAFEIENPGGVHVARAPLAADVNMPWNVADETPVEAAPIITPEEPADIFAPATADSAPADEPFEVEEPAPVAAAPEDFTNTITMADLYVRQGLIDDARHIYENILLRDPGNILVREKLNALDVGPADEDEIPMTQEFTLPPRETSAPQPSAAAAQPEQGSRAKIARLENWLKTVRGEVGSV